MQSYIKFHNLAHIDVLVETGDGGQYVIPVMGCTDILINAPTTLTFKQPYESFSPKAEYTYTLVANPTLKVDFAPQGTEIHITQKIFDVRYGVIYDALCLFDQNAHKIAVEYVVTNPKEMKKRYFRDHLLDVFLWNLLDVQGLGSLFLLSILVIITDGFWTMLLCLPFIYLGLVLLDFLISFLFDGLTEKITTKLFMPKSKGNKKLTEKRYNESIGAFYRLFKSKIVNEFIDNEFI